MKNVNLQQLFYFKIAMKCSSFSQAAEIAYTTQSTISKNISSLEEIIGEPLFIRQKKGILPTQRAIILNLELGEFYDKMDLLLNNPRQLKKEGMSVSFCQNIDFAAAIPELFEAVSRNAFFAEADIKLQCRENEEVVEGVLSGDIDLGFILSDTNVANPNIKMQTVISSVPWIFYSANSPLNEKCSLSISDFAEYPIVTTKYLIAKNDYRMINMLPFTPKRIEIVETYDDIPIYLATGMYITLLRPYVYLSNDKNIRSFPLSDDYDLKQGITMIWFGNNKNPYLKKMVSIMSRRE